MMKRLLRDFILEGVLLVLCVVLAAAAPNFLSVDNLIGIMNNVSMKGVIALGMTMVIVAGEIDLSVGSMVGFSGCLIALLTQTFTGESGKHLGWADALWVAFFMALSAAGVCACLYLGLRARWSVPRWLGVVPVVVFLIVMGGVARSLHLGFATMSAPSAIALAIVVAMGAGAWMGWVNGTLRSRFSVPTFISTLAWLTALQGLAGKITNGIPLLPFPEWYNFFGAGVVWMVPFPAILLLAVFGVCHFVMNYTTFGRSVYAVGGNEKAARLSGINVGLVKVGVMMIVAVLAVVAGVMQSSQIMTGLDRSGKGWELDVIASVIIGGTSLSGGSGRVWSTLIGIVFMGVLLNGMTLWNIDEYTQLIVRGALVLGAVMLNVALPSSAKR